MNREYWLGKATTLLTNQFFFAGDYELPENIYVSCGFAYGSKASIGQCVLNDEDTTTAHIFICPRLIDPVKILGVLLHEMMHAHLGNEAGHGPEFRKLMKEFGLGGKATATAVDEGSELELTLQSIAVILGTYPHSVIDIVVEKKPKAEQKWVRYKSVNEDMYRIVVNTDKVEEFGIPKDFNGDEMVPVKREVEEGHYGD